MFNYRRDFSTFYKGKSNLSKTVWDHICLGLLYVKILERVRKSGRLGSQLVDLTSNKPGNSPGCQSVTTSRSSGAHGKLRSALLAPCFYAWLMIDFRNFIGAKKKKERRTMHMHGWKEHPVPVGIHLKTWRFFLQHPAVREYDSHTKQKIGFHQNLLCVRFY